MTTTSNVYLTIDIDWAPDFAIDYVADLAIENQVHTTWFVTHRSKSIREISTRKDYFELGVHPNFFAKSDHGKTHLEVIEHCQELVPDALSVRTHGLVNSTNLQNLMIEKTDWKINASIFLPGAKNLKPTEYTYNDKKIILAPYMWEDSYEVGKASPLNERLCDIQSNGLSILNFHPIHIYLNSASVKQYSDLKSALTTPLNEAPKSLVDSFINPNFGIRNVFENLLEEIGGSSNPLSSLIIKFDDFSAQSQTRVPRI